ncbi:hypothetical protein [Runella salmonicolor]|uniref:Uncharacterized protein n=1 Tax=Runella salmonicolor TaxID=2950278 RepID=A0ABT1FND3_9BACT|nr:hypothetical protein [Runella salmonicolor]MCP1382288.1 hypothetical protein [Runella salmonicolor]
MAAEILRAAAQKTSTEVAFCLVITDFWVNNTAMGTLTIKSEKDQYVINIDKNLLDKDTLIKVLSWLRIEELAQKMNVDDEVFLLVVEIKSSWWE